MTLAPDSWPYVILDGRGHLNIAVWDKQNKKLIEYGKVAVNEFSGWTIGKYDWDQ